MSTSTAMTGLDAISQALGAATPVATIPRPEPSKELTEVKEAPEIENDFQEARANIKELISQMMEHVPELVELTRQSQSDKMYNAAANFINAVGNLNISLSKLTKDIKRVPVPKGQPVQDAAPVQNIQHNTVFVGSTEEFLDMMEQRKRATPIEGDFVEVESN